MPPSPPTAEKENGVHFLDAVAYEASPCHAKRYAGRDRHSGVRRSFMERLSEAKEDVAEDRDRDFARQWQREEEEVEMARRSSEKADLVAAMRLESELNDLAFAMRLQEVESKQDDEWERSEAARLAEDERVAQLLDDAINRKDRRVEEAGLRKATKFQTKELQAFLKRTMRLEKAWSQPTLNVDDMGSEGEDGIRITVDLPELDSVNVRLDESREVIVVRAVPEDAKIHAEADRLNYTLHGKTSKVNVPKSIKFAIDLRIVGSVDLTEDDIEHTYRRQEGKLIIHVRNVELSPEYKSGKRRFGLAPLKTAARQALRRLGSFNSRNTKK